MWDLKLGEVTRLVVGDESSLEKLPSPDLLTQASLTQLLRQILFHANTTTSVGTSTSPPPVMVDKQVCTN